MNRELWQPEPSGQQEQKLLDIAGAALASDPVRTIVFAGFAYFW